MPMTGEQFIHERNPSFQSTREVEDVAQYLRNHGETIPNDPAEKIAAYIGFTALESTVNDGVLTGDRESITRQVEAHVVKDTDVPEGYFDLQRKIARERGMGDQALSQDERRAHTETLQADQRKGLTDWADYLSSNDAMFPNWFKGYVFDSVTKLGDLQKKYDQDTDTLHGSYAKRSKGTTAPFPELNEEALSYVYDAISSVKLDGNKSENDKLNQLVASGNFNKLYAHALFEVMPANKELLKNTEGNWRKFVQNEDEAAGKELAETLQGYGTGWCTAGETTASRQLRGGDFFVYYSKDEAGNDTIPRVAIRMQDGGVAEVRGIGHRQELESSMVDIAEQELKKLPGGEAYQAKVQDMRTLTQLDERLKNDPNAEMTQAELRFLYETDKKIESFGWERDPRINSLLQNRNLKKDVAQIFDVAPEKVVTDLATEEIADPEVFFLKDSVQYSYLKYLEGKGIVPKHEVIQGHVGLENISKQSLNEHDALRIVAAGRAQDIAYQLDKFSGLTNKTAEALIKGGHGIGVLFGMDKFTNLDERSLINTLIQEGKSDLVATQIDKFTDIDILELAGRLEQTGGGAALAYNLPNFTNMDPQVLAILKKKFVVEEYEEKWM